MQYGRPDLLVRSCGYSPGRFDRADLSAPSLGRMDTGSSYRGYDVGAAWADTPGLAVRRLTRAGGVVPIPRVLPQYRIALSLADNHAWLAIGRRVATRDAFPAGTTVLGQPGDVFDGEMRDRVDVLFFLMEPDFVRARSAGAGVELRDLPPRQDIGLLEISRRLVAALDQGAGGDALYCDLAIEALVARLIALHGTAAAGRLPYRETLTSARLRGLIGFVEDNLAGPLRLAELADVAALSRAHFARAFRAATGQAPHRYVLQRRLHRAHDLLRRTDLAVAEIGARCGFADPAHFSRVYRRHFGMPPSAGRR